jgi:hypothetical protein
MQAFQHPTISVAAYARYRREGSSWFGAGAQLLDEHANGEG